MMGAALKRDRKALKGNGEEVNGNLWVFKENVKEQWECVKG